MILLIVLAILGTSGCTRTLYRRQADREANYLVREKSVGTPWQVPDSFTIQPDPRSRFFDPTDPDFPTLPPAGPHLYDYQLPIAEGGAGGPPEPLPPGLPSDPSGGEIAPPPLPPPPANQASVVGASPIQLVSFQEDPAAPQLPARRDPFLDYIATLGAQKTSVKELEAQPIAAKYWNDIPDYCQARMLEFQSVRAEYEDTFGVPPGSELLSSAPRVGLTGLFDLALINSRDYQRQKEILYELALNVSIERFAYATKFSPQGGTVDTTYTHLRADGTTINTLSVPSTISGDKVLASGGTLVGQFANDVFLTFNGPNGFAADVSSELLLQVTQRVLRRDILLEPLIQSERNLVYGARDFARYRKEFFFDVASQYYGVLLRYRTIEIVAQNYFAQVRNLQQALQEVESEISTAPNITFLNQFEQSVLQARSNLISACNSLEQSLDNMKFSVGLPTETPINIDLTELDQLTLRDMIEVSREQAARWESRLKALRKAASQASHSDMLTADYSLAERLIKWLSERGRITQNPVDPRTVFTWRAMFLLDAARLDYLSDRQALDETQSADPPKQRILVFQRQVEVIESLLTLIRRQIEYAEALGNHDPLLARSSEQVAGFQREFDELLNQLNEALEGSPDDQVIINLLDGATSLLANSQTVSQNLDNLLFGEQVESVELQETIAHTDALLKLSDEVFSETGRGLPPIDISVDQAMVTALVQRLDLMNERGALADSWREIKIAADELRSNLNLTASQSLRTDQHRPFAFSTDNATTRLGVSWDLPLNRRLERNLYRRSLINYNAGLRGLMQFEDSIKLNVRDELRNLDLARVQYPIAVASAALAEEQVLSTRLKLLLGLQDVRASDLVEAYNDSRQALADMVQLRIGYILERAQFALDLEVMMLDDTGYWPEINDAQYQPPPNGIFPANAGSAYGDYPSYLRVSHEFRRMLNYPPPHAPTPPEPDKGTVEGDLEAYEGAGAAAEEPAEPQLLPDPPPTPPGASR